MIRGQLEKALSKVLVAPEAKPQTLKEHVAIIKAIRNRDPEAAGEAMRNHLSAARIETPYPSYTRKRDGRG